MKTITILIGNSDNKLTQKEWSEFVAKISEKVDSFSHQIQFSGGSDARAPWQNFCWVIECENGYEDLLRSEIVVLRRKFKQDSVAWISIDSEDVFFA